MKTFFIILRREFAQLALTPALYGVLAALTGLYSYVFYSELVATEQSHIQPVAFLFGMMSLFLVPIITMRSFAGETATGTLELLLTAPVRPLTVVLGKFAGVFLFYLLSLLPYCGYAILLAHYGEVDRGTLITTAIGLALIGAAQTAAGIFVSALTANIIVAAAGACALNFFFFMFALPLDHGASVFSFPAHFSWWAHFREIFGKGMADTRSLVFFALFIALFLFLTWLLLVAGNAFGGGEKSNRRRLTIAGICGVLGINLLGFGWTSGNLREAFAEANWQNFWLLLGGGLFIVALIFWRRARRGAARWRENYPLLLAATSAILIFININYLATWRFPQLKTYHRWDLTAQKTNTLSPEIQTALDLLEEPLTITVFLSEGIDYDGVPLARQLRDLLGEFTSYSPQVKVEFYDALTDAETAAARARELDLPTLNLTQLVVVNYGERRQVITAENFLQAPDKHAQMTGNKTPTFQGEIVFAIVTRRLSDRQSTKIYFATQIGEAPAYGTENVLNCTGLFAEALAREAYELRPWAFTGKEEIPADSDVLILTGFSQPLPESYAQKLENYLARGGRLLLLLPAPDGTTPLGIGNNYRTGLEKMLGVIGVRARGDLVFDEKNNFAGQSTQILALMDAAAPFTINHEQPVLVMPNTQTFAVRENNNDDGVSDWQTWRVVRSLTPSKRFLPTASNPLPTSGKNLSTGSATLIVAAARPAKNQLPEARAVIAGSVGWASNLFIRREQNQAFLLSATRWLAGRHYQIGAIKMREYLTYKVKMTPADWRLLWWLTLIAMPEIWLLLAIGVWWYRKE